MSTDWWLESSLVLLVGEGAPLFFLVLPIVALKEFDVLIFSRIVACFLSHNLLPVFPTCTIYVLDILHVYFLFQFVVYMYFQIVRCMYWIYCILLIPIKWICSTTSSFIAPIHQILIEVTFSFLNAGISCCRLLLLRWW